MDSHHNEMIKYAKHKLKRLTGGDVQSAALMC